MIPTQKVFPHPTPEGYIPLPGFIREKRDSEGFEEETGVVGIDGHMIPVSIIGACEADQIVLRPNRLYITQVKKDCPACARIGRTYGLIDDDGNIVEDRLAKINTAKQDWGTP